MPTIGADPTDRKAEPRSDATRYAVFQVSGETYAMALADVREVLPWVQLSRPPGMPSLLAGFLNLGGQAVAVLRLDALFGLPEMTPELFSPIILLREGDPPLALLARKLAGIATARSGDVSPIPTEASFNACATGTVSLALQTVVLLSGRSIVSEKERRCLIELQALEQARLNGLRMVEP